MKKHIFLASVATGLTVLSTGCTVEEAVDIFENKIAPAVSNAADKVNNFADENIPKAEKLFTDVSNSIKNVIEDPSKLSEELQVYSEKLAEKIPEITDEVANKIETSIAEGTPPEYSNSLSKNYINKLSTDYSMTIMPIIAETPNAENREKGTPNPIIVEKNNIELNAFIFDIEKYNQNENHTQDEDVEEYKQYFTNNNGEWFIENNNSKYAEYLNNFYKIINIATEENYISNQYIGAINALLQDAGNNEIFKYNDSYIVFIFNQDNEIIGIFDISQKVLYSIAFN